jgi:hypothetical protein
MLAGFEQLPQRWRETVSEQVLEPANRALGIQPIKPCDPAERSSEQYGNSRPHLTLSLQRFIFSSQPISNEMKFVGRVKLRLDHSMLLVPGCS